jgi:hypothetical protein
MLNIPGHKRNIYQNHIDSTSLLLEWLSSRTQTTTHVGKNMGKRSPHTPLMGMSVSTTTMENCMEFSFLVFFSKN